MISAQLLPLKLIFVARKVISGCTFGSKTSNTFLSPVIFRLEFCWQGYIESIYSNNILVMKTKFTVCISYYESYQSDSKLFKIFAGSIIQRICMYYCICIQVCCYLSKEGVLGFLTWAEGTGFTFNTIGKVVQYFTLWTRLICNYYLLYSIIHIN